MEAVLFSSYFPNIRYFSKFLIYDSIVIDILENYTKQTYRNRCNIMSANGISQLSVPVKKNFHCHVKDIEIDYSENWQTNHYRAILSAYKNSAFYEYYIDDIMPFFERKEKFLLDLNSKILEKTFEIIRLNPNFRYSEEFVTDNSIHDFRETIHPKPQKNTEDPDFRPAEYIQVFSERHGFCPDLSILDLIFNEGPMSLNYLKRCII
jgi:hypothetical protein